MDAFCVRPMLRPVAIRLSSFLATAARRMIFAVAAILLAGATVQAAQYRTPNFIVTAPTDEFARAVGEAAEVFRKDLSISWTGREMPRWFKPCPIQCKVGDIPAGGATTFHFDQGEVFGWNMDIQGTPERLLDSVLPHEINHTIFACHFRRPLPRWADEGAASLIEHESERMRLEKIAVEAVSGRRKIPLRTLLGMKDYPSDQRSVLILYGQGYLIADYLIAKSSKPEYLRFLQTAYEKGWEYAFAKHYQYKRIEDFEGEHDRWVVAGCPRNTNPPETMLAANDRTTSAASSASQPASDAPFFRGQDPESTTEIETGKASQPLPALPRPTRVAGIGRSSSIHDNPLMSPGFDDDFAPPRSKSPEAGAVRSRSRESLQEPILQVTGRR